jgi:serine/threonine-protein kinase
MADFNALIGQQFGSCTVLRLIGAGSMAAVYLGYQASLKRQVALKVLAKAQSDRKANPRQFTNEAEIIAGLSHPNIVPMFDFGETDEYFFQVMQLIQGEDLAALKNRRLKHPLASKRLLELDEIVTICIQVLDGLGYAHEEGIVHQDVKPANIIIEQRSGRPMVVDFGVARAMMLQHPGAGMIVGTPYYLAPEQAAAQTTDGRADIYAVGTILFELAAGQLPLHQEGVKELLKRKFLAPETIFKTPPSQTHPRIDTALEEIILKAVHPQLSQRYATAGDFSKALTLYRSQRLGRSTTQGAL